MSAPALAAAPEAPEVTVETPVHATEATFHGVVNPLAVTFPLEAGIYQFVYRPSTKAEDQCKGTGEILAPASAGMYFGLGPEPFTETVTGLTQHTEYAACLVAEDGEGKTASPAVTFTTTTPEPPTAGEAKPIAPTTTTLHGILNPKHEGLPETYEFVYRQSLGGCQGAGEAATLPELAAGAVGEAVEHELTGLLPGTTYTFCLRTRNEAGEALSAPVTFATLAITPVIVPESESVTEVTATSAKLNAEVDPGAQETTYRFEYGTNAAYGQSTSEAGPFGSAGESQVTAAIQGLQPNTTYHYHVVASNSQSPGGTPGPDQTFTTQTAGGKFTLPDGRQWELVSLPQKDGGEILGVGGGNETPPGGDATQASEDGTSVTYIANAPVGSNPPGNTFSTQILSTRGAGGWSSQDISSPHKNPVNSASLGFGEEYLRFSPDLSRAVVMPSPVGSEPSLAPEVHEEVHNEPPTGKIDEIYLRNDATGVFQAVVTAEPLPKVEFQGATPDLSHIAFAGPAGLDPNYPGASGLYEWADGHAQLVSVLPDGEAGGGAHLGGVLNQSVSEVPGRHAISDDGTRIVWGNGSELFTRDEASGETVQVDAAQGGGGPSGGGVFWDATSDGRRVFFTDQNELTSGAHEGGLFMFDVADGKLTDVAPGVNGAFNSQTYRHHFFLGANEEGTSVYVDSSVVLTNVANGRGETAAAGAGNVYLLREAPADSGSWNATFVTAGLSEPEEESRGNVEERLFINLGDQTVGVSPNGRYLAFMSQQSLTGYDNRDANSGEPDEEVYLYDADANRLVCASCDPTGARPVGENATHEVGKPNPLTPLDPWAIWEGHWLAATIPGWTKASDERTTGYQQRFLSDSGRLFFDSSDALVPQDVNGREDVYEYESEGVGSCQPPAYGQSASVVFSGVADGCVGLISAGTGTGDSAFFDASASGNDVFFTTEDGLVAQDKDGVSDMYDARVCTVAEPCSQSPVASPPCSTTDSCRAAPAPPPGVFGAPASATFAGAGNVAPTPVETAKPRTKRKTAAQVRAEKLAKALRACGKRPRRKRAACDARARKRYDNARTSGRRTK